MTHHELCILAGQWLHRKGKGFNLPVCNYVTIETNAVGIGCIADVFGWGDGIGIGWAGVQIEVKMSHQDFLNDKRKASSEDKGFDVGYLKFYCCPDGIIKVEELPEDFGLLYYADGEIKVIREAKYRNDKSPSREVPLIASVMRRLGIKGGVFDFRKNKIQDTVDYE